MGKGVLLPFSQHVFSTFIFILFMYYNLFILFMYYYIFIYIYYYGQGDAFLWP